MKFGMIIILLHLCSFFMSCCQQYQHGGHVNVRDGSYVSASEHMLLKSCVSAYVHGNSTFVI